MKIKHLLVMICVAAAFSIAANTRQAANELIGTWKYKVSDVPPEYESGYMTFEETGGKISGYLGKEEKSPMKEMTIDQERVIFKIDFQGGLITLDMTRKGDKLEGVVTTPDGTFPIVAMKEKN